MFGSTLGGELGAIGGHSVFGNSQTANELFASACENGPLGLTADDDGFYYYGSRGLLGVASASICTAAALVGVEILASAGLDNPGVHGAARMVERVGSSPAVTWGFQAATRRSAVQPAGPLGVNVIPDEGYCRKS